MSIASALIKGITYKNAYNPSDRPQTIDTVLVHNSPGANYIVENMAENVTMTGTLTYPLPVYHFPTWEVQMITEPWKLDARGAFKGALGDLLMQPGELLHFSGSSSDGSPANFDVRLG